MATDKARNLGNLLQQAKQGASSKAKAGDVSEHTAQESESGRQRNRGATSKAEPTNSGEASPNEFWAQFDQEDSEATDRLNVEIRRSLHERFKRQCVELGVTKRQAVEALLEWSLGGK